MTKQPTKIIWTDKAGKQTSIEFIGSRWEKAKLIALAYITSKIVERLF